MLTRIKNMLCNRKSGKTVTEYLVSILMDTPKNERKCSALLALDTFLTEIKKESDRGIVLFTAALIDEALFNALILNLEPRSSKSDILFSGSAPLNLAQKIELAYRIRLISNLFADKLDLIRKIRNDFAHNALECTFDNPRIESRVKELVKNTICQGLNIPLKIQDMYGTGAKCDFITVTSAFVTHLWSPILQKPSHSHNRTDLEWMLKNK